MKMRTNLLKTQNSRVYPRILASSWLFCDDGASAEYCFFQQAASTFCISHILWKAFLPNSTVNMGRYCSPELLTRYSKGLPKIFHHILRFSKVFQDVAKKSEIFRNIPKSFFTWAEWCSLAWNTFPRQADLGRPQQSARELQGIDLVLI